MGVTYSYEPFTSGSRETEEVRDLKHERDWMCEKLSIAGLKMKGGKRCGWPLGAESNPWLMTNKEMGAPVLQLQQIEFC